MGLLVYAKDTYRRIRFEDYCWHSNTLAWKIPWTEEPGGLQSMGSLSRTRLSDFTFTFHFYALEKKMATHSGVLAWRIPGMGEPGGLPSMGSHRVGHDWNDLAAAADLQYICKNMNDQIKEFFYSVNVVFKKYLFIWLHRILATACKLLSSCAPQAHWIYIFKVKKIYWTIVDSQWCISFRHSRKWFSI